MRATSKPFTIEQKRGYEAYKAVKPKAGGAGVDCKKIEQFEADLKNNLYRVWNRMSSGSYFPPPVRAVEIPKPHGGGTRILGVPTVADRGARGWGGGWGDAGGGRGWSRSSIQTRTATVQGEPRRTRWRSVGGVVG